jgi:flagellar FliL protein
LSDKNSGAFVAEENESTEAGASSSGNSGKLLGLVFVLVNLICLGGGSFLAYKGTIGYEVASLSNADARRELASFEETLRTEPVMYSMPVFSTNLDGTPRRLIRVNLSVEMMDAEGYEEVITLGAEARDSVLRILNAKSFLDVESVQGKLHLKNEIVTELNGFLKKGVVKNVYFSDFVIQ